MSAVTLGFALQPLEVSVDRLLPSKKLPAGIQTSRKYLQIKASIAEVGLIEPLAISPVQGTSGLHAVLDGHVRLSILHDLAISAVTCLVAKDDEAYTYNKRINRLSSVQEHFMILRAIERGVPRERIAKALNMHHSQISKRESLLDGICPEAVELLKDQVFAADMTRALRRMKPVRQVECVELMVSATNLTVPYSQALLAATPAEMLMDGKKARSVKGIGPEQMARMEHEMSTLQGRMRLVENAYGEDVLNLVVSRAFLVKLLANEYVARFLRQHYSELSEQLSQIAAATALDR